MSNIFNRMYALYVRRQLSGSHAQFSMVYRHYHRLASMYGAENVFSIAR